MIKLTTLSKTTGMIQ